MVTRKIGNILGLIREVNLEQIQEEAKQRFLLLVAGQSEPDALSIAQQFSGTGTIHPWIEVKTLPFTEPLDAYTTALLVTSRDDLNATEHEARAAFRNAGVPVVVVRLGAAQAREALPRRDEAARVNLTSATDEVGFTTVLVPELLELRPDLQVAFGRQFQGIRPLVAQYLIDETARANATYAFTTGLAETVPVLNVPLNLADVVVLTKNQLLMAYKVALALGKEGQPTALMGEVVGVLGGGLLFRQIARQLVGLIPGLGIPAKTAVAYAGTVVIGRAIYAWATQGAELTPEELKELAEEAAQRGRSVAAELVEQGRKRLPNRRR